MSIHQVNQLEHLLRQAEKPGGGQFSAAQIGQLAHYYELVLKWNQRLHLTTITNPQEFLDRHVLESAFAESHLLKSISELWDLGTGLGIPGIPMAILRPEMTVNLVEANRSKTVFLDEAVFALQLSNVKVICSRFETLSLLPEGSALTARAVEKMEKMVSEIIKLGEQAAQILLLGSSDLAERIKREIDAGWKMKPLLLPKSDNRLLIKLYRPPSATRLWDRR